jgi:polyhydroxyalkanoate synthesis regulator phasin
MAKGFSDLTTDEKFKAVRDDIRTVADHSNQNQRDIAATSQSLSELRREIQQLTEKVEALSKKIS